jgi:hypothetical protein
MSTICITTSKLKRLIFVDKTKDFAKILHNSLIECNITNYYIKQYYHNSFDFDLNKITDLKENDVTYKNAKIDLKTFYDNEKSNDELIFSKIYQFFNNLNIMENEENIDTLTMSIPMIYLSKNIQNIIGNNLDDCNYEFLIESEIVLNRLYSKLDNLLYFMQNHNDEYVIID